MPTLSDLARRGAILVIVHLGRREPISMAEFTRASELVADRAKVLREELEELGLIAAHFGPRRGAQVRLEIRLTPLGRDVADHLLAVENALLEHKDERVIAK